MVYDLKLVLICLLDITNKTTNDFSNDTEVPSKNQRHTYNNTVHTNEQTHARIVMLSSLHQPIMPQFPFYVQDKDHVLIVV